MSASVKPKPTGRYRSGHCGIGLHAHCRGVYAGTYCTCGCHFRCVTCGQTLPMGTP